MDLMVSRSVRGVLLWYRYQSVFRGVIAQTQAPGIVMPGWNGGL